MFDFLDSILNRRYDFGKEKESKASKEGKRHGAKNEIL